MKEKLRVLIGSVILLPHIVTFVCLKMSSGGEINSRPSPLEAGKRNGR